MWWDVNGSLAAIERRVGDSGDDLFWSFCDYGSYNIQIGSNGKNFYVNLTTLSLLDLSLNLDCVLNIRKFNAA